MGGGTSGDLFHSRVGANDCVFSLGGCNVLKLHSRALVSKCLWAGVILHSLIAPLILWAVWQSRNLNPTSPLPLNLK